MHQFKKLMIYLIVVFPIFAFCILMFASGTVTIFYSGFAVDCKGALYIGKDRRIDKYMNAQKIGEINPQTSRGYAFTIENGDTIVLSTASNVYWLDLTGKVVQQQEDIGTRTFNALQSQRKHFTTATGENFTLESRFGRAQIVTAGGKVIYEMPLFDYCVKLCFIAVFVSLWIFIPAFIVELRKGNHRRGSEPLNVNTGVGSNSLKK